MTDPGSWHYFTQRADMKNKSLNKQKSQFLKEQINHQNLMAVIANANASSGGISPTPSETPSSYPYSVKQSANTPGPLFGYEDGPSEDIVLTRHETLTVNGKPIYGPVHVNVDGDNLHVAIAWYDALTDSNGDTQIAGWEICVKEDTLGSETDQSLVNSINAEISNINGGGAFEDLEISTTRLMIQDQPPIPSYPTTPFDPRGNYVSPWFGEPDPFVVNIN